MVRKLTAALLGVGVFVPGLANALGLGEIKLNSHLSEPLNAEIELVQVRELTEGEILPGLASPDDFTSAGVERFHHLTDMKFEVVVNTNGRSYIKVKTRKPIREPFVNFLVEVHWPAGRLLREYTLLLDPPNFSLAAPQPVQAAVTAPAPQPAVQPKQTAPQTSSVTAPTTTSPATANTADSSESASGGGKTYGPTKGSDSLWSIAKVLRPSDEVSMHQTMIAIQQLNPDAFIDGNINLLKKGKILRGPSVGEASQFTNNEAVNRVQQQNRAWKERISQPGTAAETETAQIDTSGRSVDSFEETVRGDEGRLRLVSADTDTGSADSGLGGSSSDDGVLRQRAELAEESADKFRLENDDLKGKVAELEEQVGTSEKLLDLKDDQIAALQARLAKLEQEMKQAQSNQMPVEEMPAQVEEPVVEPVEPPVIEPVVEAEPEVAAEESEQPVDYNFEEEQQQASLPAEPVAGDETKPQQAIQVEQTPKKVVVDTPPQPKAPQPTAAPSFLEQLTQNPLYMAIAGGGIAVLAVLALVIGRRKKEESDEIDEALVEDFSLNVEEEAPALAEQAELPDEADMGGEETVPQTADVLGEADIYIAYGRFPQAIEMLEKAAEAEPTRSDIRMKLLETCVEAKDQDAFMRHYNAVQELAVADDMARADALKGQFIGNESFDSDFGDIAEPGDETLVADTAPAGSYDLEPETLSEDVPAEDLDFNLDDDDATLVQPASSPLESADTDLEDKDAGLDFDFDLPESLDEPASEPVSEEAQSLDTSLDFSLDTDTVPESPVEATSEEDTSLDFDSEFNLDLPEESPVEEDDTVVSFGEAEESLDFELAEEAEELEEPSAELTEDTMEFDLDLDSVGVEADEDDTLVAPEGLQPSSGGEEEVIDPDAAAKLADELDLDGDFDLDLDVGETEIADAGTEATSDDLEFSVEEDSIAEHSEPELAESEVDVPDLAEPEALETDSEASTDSSDLDLNLDADLDLPTTAEESFDTVSLDVDEVPAVVAPVVPTGDAANSEEELDFLTDADETSTKLDLARAYIDMGDREGAKDILDEVLIEGNEDQQGEAKDLLARLD